MLSNEIKNSPMSVGTLKENLVPFDCEFFNRMNWLSKLEGFFSATM